MGLILPQKRELSSVSSASARVGMATKPQLELGSVCRQWGWGGGTQSTLRASVKQEGHGAAEVKPRGEPGLQPQLGYGPIMVVGGQELRMAEAKEAELEKMEPAV